MLQNLFRNNVLPAAACLMMLSACTSSTGTGSSSDVSYDGLTRVPDTAFQEVYRRAGADINSYGELGLAPCNVAFKKNWLRDQNSTRMDLSNRVTQQDVDRIKDALGSMCDEQFREALLEEPAYTLADKFDEGEQVLVLKPSIINLDISAPDVMSANRSRAYTTSSGEMTLSLELVDATTGEILARAVDRRRGLDDSRMQWTSSVSNSADAKRTLKRWSKILREGLDEARGQ
jgi:Protein of unknown function (DUF3313)